MFAVCFCALLTTIHLVIGILIPGLFLEMRLSRVQKLATDVSAVLVRIIALGSLYLLLQFISLQLADIFWHIPRFEMVIAKYAMDLAILLGMMVRFRAESWAIVVRIFSGLRSPSILSLVVGSITLGCFAMVICPYSLDSSPIAWTSKYLDIPGLSVLVSKGSPTYIAMLYFPSQLLASWYPVPTIAASLKPALCLLTVLAIVRVVNRLPLKNREWLYGIFFLTLAASFFGIYGLQQTGKHSVFGATFLIIFLADLLLPPESESESFCVTQAGLSLSATMGLGVIAVPYALVISTLFLLLSANRIKCFRVALSLVLWASVPFVLNLSPMVHIPLWQSVSLTVVVACFCWCLSKTQGLKWFATMSSRPWFQFIPVFIILISWVGLSFALPVKFADGRPPLDGETSFFELLFKYDRVIPEHVVLSGLIGVLICCTTPRFSRIPGLMAYAIFPFVTLLAAMIVAHFPPSSIPLHPQHFWDLVKDVPNWCYGFYFGLFSVIFVDLLVEYVRDRQAKRAVSQDSGLKVRDAGKMIMIASLIIAASIVSNKWTKGPNWWGRSVHYTSVGGHRDPLFAVLAETLVRHQQRDARSEVNGNKLRLTYISQTSPVNECYPRFYMYGIRIRQDLDLSSEEQWSNVLKNLPARIVAKRDDFATLLESGRLRVSVEEVERLSETDSVFRVSPEDEQRGAIRFAEHADVLVPNSMYR